MISLVGRASVLCTEGRGFESRIVHTRSLKIYLIFYLINFSRYVTNSLISFCPS